jgi:hypothetical protein
MWFPCTPTPDPQRPNIGHTLVNRVIHNPSTPLAATKPGCPQNAQPLILVLRSLRRFFFEVQGWVRPLRRSRGGVVVAACRPGRLAFKMAAEDLRLWFDC